MHNIKKISTLHAKLWRYHDEKKWDELEYFSKEFLISLGNSEVLAAELAPLVKETFLISDMAEKCKDERKFNQEDKKYKQIKHILKIFILN